MQTLLLWDEKLEKRLLTEALQALGLAVRHETDLEHAFEDWGNRPASLILMAQRLSEPEQAVYTIRRHSVAPLILLLNPVGEDRHFNLLDSGADMVLERPYSTRLFLGYVKVFMRRAETVLSDSLPVVKEEKVRLDPSRHVVQVGDGTKHRLSQLEFRLLHTLMVHRNQVLSTDTIVEHVWGYTGEGHRDLVRGLVNRLRSKIEVNRRAPEYIHTVPGIGYSFQSQSDGDDGPPAKQTQGNLASRTINRQGLKD
ncbi:MAG: response regulator transcription factor [Chloroflexota bacterium]